MLCLKKDLESSEPSATGVAQLILAPQGLKQHKDYQLNWLSITPCVSPNQEQLGRMPPYPSLLQT